MHKEYANVEGYGSFDDDHDEGTKVYDTINELFSEKIARAWEDDSNYYLQHESEASTGWSDSGMYKIEKKTKKVDYMNYMPFMFTIEEKTTVIAPEYLKRVLK